MFIISTNANQTASIYELLPSKDQDMILELSKRLLLACDADYTKVLSHEAKIIEEALDDYRKGMNVCDGSSIEW